MKRAIRVAEDPHQTHVFWLTGTALRASVAVSALSVIIAEAPFSKLAVSESLSIRIPQGAFLGFVLCRIEARGDRLRENI